MKDTYDKIKIIDNLPDTPIKEPIGIQSVKSTFQCGCSVVMHKYAGKPSGNREENPERYDRQHYNRLFFATLCSQHEN